MSGVDFQVLFNIAVALLGTLGGWVIRTIWGASERLRRDLSELERQLPGSYVRRDDFKEFGGRIEALLEKIDQKLDRKMDKSGT